MDVKKLIKKGESEILEFKESFSKATIETAVAFSNSKGGIVLIGVSNKGKIKGASVGKETLKEWINKISQATEPVLIPGIESYVIRDKTIVAMTVKESPLKPVAHRGICFLRIGNSNKKLTPKEISELHLQTVGSSWDAQPAKDTSVENIDYKRVKFYIELANKTGRRKITEKPLEVLKKLELIKGAQPTWAALLLFGKNPQAFLPQAKIHCGRFKDEITIIDDKLVDGDAIEQIDEVTDFVKKHLEIKFKITGEARRKEIWEYPLEAIREAVINAVCHRDYTESSDIQIRIYEDRLVVWSPGKLPLGITLGDLYKPHKSVLRNKLVAQAFFDIGYIERWGTGIERMRNACKNQDLPEPKFEEYLGFRVTFRKDIYTDEYLRTLGLNERQRKTVKLAKSKGKVTNKDCQELFFISKQTATRDLSHLVDLDIFRKIGPTGRSVYYVLA